MSRRVIIPAIEIWLRRGKERVRLHATRSHAVKVAFHPNAHLVALQDVLPDGIVRAWKPQWRRWLPLMEAYEILADLLRDGWVVDQTHRPHAPGFDLKRGVPIPPSPPKPEWVGTVWDHVGDGNLLSCDFSLTGLQEDLPLKVAASTPQLCPLCGSRWVSTWIRCMGCTTDEVAAVTKARRTGRVERRDKQRKAS